MHINDATATNLFDSQQQPSSVTLSSSSSSSSSDDESDDAPQPTTSSIPVKKIFKCNLCGRCCHCKSKLTRHMNSHSGARPFKCTKCSKMFKTPCHLVHHRKVHSPPAFKCDFCAKMFTYKHTRDTHMNSHTEYYIRQHRNTHSAPKYTSVLFVTRCSLL